MKMPNNKLSSVQKYVYEKLNDQFSADEKRVLFYQLCEAFIHLKSHQVPISQDVTLTESELLLFIYAVKDLNKNKPIQYILGHATFCDWEFEVNQNTLIPRPETEELVHWICETIEQNDCQTLLDIGTGSGCIPIATQLYQPQISVTSIDISEEALSMARKNADRLNAKVDFLQMDALSPFSDEFQQSFDIIVSNPPYVTESDKQEMHANVLDFEPHLALFVSNESPLIFYQNIIQQAQKLLNKNGFLFFEINEAYGQELLELLKEWNNVALREDFLGKPRMIRAQK